ncbi:MAG TPA: tRNA (adenosine(37)-N6)-dimethylallyltransferase MiaA, partial [Candidatus Baltobacteraceae bacterium]|nr:tRNA (adenosine(37)-N6)-dimethylallyltransferase MiaA [Candidatus Baltobacteraceae bacterium]
GPDVLILCAPTASGKSALALELAELFDAEIVGADSRQIYAGMPIGTAAPSASERARVAHHLVGFLDPGERYRAARFRADALAAIDDIQARGKRAIVVGGTGFYVRALTGGVALDGAFDPELRDRLAREARLHPRDVLHEWLAARNPARASRIASSDRYRVLRALEITLSKAGEATAARSLERPTPRFLKVWVEIGQSLLDERIAARVDAMLAAGFLEEAEALGRVAVAADAVGYPHALAYLAGHATRAELRALMIRATRRYAKRQRTWFRNETGMTRVAHDAAREALARLARGMTGWA